MRNFNRGNVMCLLCEPMLASWKYFLGATFHILLIWHRLVLLIEEVELRAMVLPLHKKTKNF